MDPQEGKREKKDEEEKKLFSSATTTSVRGLTLWQKLLPLTIFVEEEEESRKVCRGNISFGLNLAQPTNRPTD